MWVRSTGERMINRGKSKDSNKACLSPLFAVTNSAWNAIATKPALRSKNSTMMTELLNYGEGSVK